MSSGNVTSVLLSPQENQRVFSMLGPRRKSLATSVVELYTAGGRYNARSTACWTYCTMGVLCLVKDAEQRSYFFRVYCPVKGILVWEQEFYSGMVYLQPKPYLHTFEAEDCIAGFNFADESEAAAHRRVVLEKLELKNRQLERRLTRRWKNSSFEMVEKADFLSGVVQPKVEEPKPSKKSSKKKDSAKKKPKLAKVDISTPFDFKHICHVGWNKDRGFDFLNADPQLKAFFQQAGISETHLRHKGTRDFIYKFIEDNGGMDALAVEMDPAGRRPQQPTSNSHQQQRSSNNNGPQQGNIYEELKSFPNDAGRNSNKKQQLQKRQLPPPPPLLTVTGADGNKTGLVPPPPALPPSRQQVAPPPPPPPPISPPMPPPIVVDRDPQPSSVEDPRSNLLQEIRSGKALKHIGDNDKKEPTTLGSRNQLLDQIKSGVHLRSTPTSPSSSPRQSKAIEQSGGLAGALAKALQERTKAMHSDSSGGSSEDEEDEEEWND